MYGATGEAMFHLRKGSMMAAQEGRRSEHAMNRLERIWRSVAWILSSSIAAVGLRALLDPVLGSDFPYLTVFPAVVLASLASGWIAGMSALGLTLAALVVLFVEPRSALAIAQPGDMLGLLLSAGVCLLLIGVGAAYRRLRLSSDLAAQEAQQVASSLRESEERFRRLAELSPDAILVLSGGVVAYTNAATLRLLGATHLSQVLGHSPFELVHPDSRAVLEARIGRVLTTGQPNPPMEQRYYRFDGRLITVETTSTLVPWGGGVAVQVIARDVTERRRAEEELREKKEELEDFLEDSPVPIHWVAPNGRILRANRAELELLGYAPEEYIGRAVREFHVEPEKADEMLERLFRGETLCRHEAQLRSRSGAIRQVILDANVQMRDGRIAHTRCFTLDITEQRRAEHAVQMALDRFRLCARATNDVIYDWDILGNRVEWNEVIKTVAGEVDEATRARHEWWRRQVHPDDLPRIEETLKGALHGRDEQWTAEYRFRRADGAYAAVFDRAFIVRDGDGRATRMVGAIIDVTERRRFEEELARRAAELERSNADLQDFAQIISHDLKAPLRGIADYAGYLLEGYSERLDDEGRDMLHTLLRLSGRMHELLDALMEYARVGRAELRTARTDLNSILAGVLESLETRLESERAQVVLAAPLPSMRCDPILISQVFTNLIINGLKYNTREEKRIEIGCRPGGKGEDVVFVRDNGIGIEERHREAIFQMFRRLHPGETFGGGTGSGLSIVKKIVERHSGRIWVDSTPGEGSTFFFTLGHIEDEPPAVKTMPLVREAWEG